MRTRGRLRIIGGTWRSRIIHFPPAADLRPTPDRVRETLFNWLGQDLSGKTCLDLFSGSGALGFEALSRGARKVVMVEKNRDVFQALRDNALKLRAQNLELVHANALQFLSVDRNAYHVIFLDPPFRKNGLGGILAEMPRRLEEGGLVYVESGNAFDAPDWEVWREGRAGKVHYRLLKWKIT
ncbi:MAG TPA: 16S rRNA (guanine(966)-N(2))-methyltransferase RsmD [Burkholderiales bacterium]|jgi:16S rRNA (guanine966-N2)-methyltransferase|nr:16S rRNA (guanine(966)-N(2))-methyltransferase RsmD [Burkholderiales bacterium]